MSKTPWIIESESRGGSVVMRYTPNTAGNRIAWLFRAVAKKFRTR